MWAALVFRDRSNTLEPTLREYCLRDEQTPCAYLVSILNNLEAVYIDHLTCSSLGRQYWLLSLATRCYAQHLCLLSITVEQTYGRSEYTDPDLNTEIMQDFMSSAGLPKSSFAV